MWYYLYVVCKKVIIEFGLKENMEYVPHNISICNYAIGYNL